MGGFVRSCSHSGNVDEKLLCPGPRDFVSPSSLLTRSGASRATQLWSRRGWNARSQIASPTHTGQGNCQVALAPPFNLRATKKKTPVLEALVLRRPAPSHGMLFATAPTTIDALRNESDGDHKSATVRRRLSSCRGEVREPRAHSLSEAAGFRLLWVLLVIEGVLEVLHILDHVCAQ